MRRDRLNEKQPVAPGVMQQDIWRRSCAYSRGYGKLQEAFSKALAAMRHRRSAGMRRSILSVPLCTVLLTAPPGWAQTLESRVQVLETQLATLTRYLEVIESQGRAPISTLFLPRIAE